MKLAFKTIYLLILCAMPFTIFAKPAPDLDEEHFASDEQIERWEEEAAQELSKLNPKAVPERYTMPPSFEEEHQKIDEDLSIQTPSDDAEVLSYPYQAINVAADDEEPLDEDDQPNLGAMGNLRVSPLTEAEEEDWMEQASVEKPAQPEIKAPLDFSSPTPPKVGKQPMPEIFGKNEEEMETDQELQLPPVQVEPLPVLHESLLEDSENAVELPELPSDTPILDDQSSDDEMTQMLRESLQTEPQEVAVKSKKAPSKTALKKVKPVVPPPPSLPLDFDQAEPLLSQVYLGINAFVIPSDEAELIHKSGGNPTYGEITPQALRTLLSDLQLDGKDVFYSLGSGSGKEVLYVALATPAKAVGVELSETRYNLAQSAKQSIQKSQNVYLGNKARFMNKDIMNVKNLKRATVVYINNLCFSDKFMEQMAEKFKSLKDGAIILTIGKQLPERPFYELKHTYNLPMTWSTSTPVYRYEVLKKTIARRPLRTSETVRA